MRFFIFTQVGRRIGKTQTWFCENIRLETPLCCARNPDFSHAFTQSLQEKWQDCTQKWTTNVSTPVLTNSWLLSQWILYKH